MQPFATTSQAQIQVSASAPNIGGAPLRSKDFIEVDRDLNTMTVMASTSSPTASASSGTASTLPIAVNSLLPEPIDDNAPQSADAMTGVGKDPLASAEFFGGSSAASFAAQINSVVDSRLGTNQTQSSIEVTNEASEGAGANQESATTLHPDYMNFPAFALPLRTFSDRLLQDYYDLVWVIPPIHDWVVFKQDYDAIWVGSKTKTHIKPLHCMINMALALGAQFSQIVQPDKRRSLVKHSGKEPLYYSIPESSRGLRYKDCNVYCRWAYFYRALINSTGVGWLLALLFVWHKV
ncbi:hypothetical protein FSPOR_11863 [Fusarium sporotrichioides]|uniref:Uncharacterized protein n=1 Tax=Fusarium sporotrichioides TaxID=5514 RepID=A0A395RFR1_FUSSP|nr:hypothetical protein FSPOR_11863 [Fusarium sporotrichioides]